MKLFSVLAVILFFTAPGCYSFKGISIPPDVKSVTIHFFPNQASFVSPSLSQVFTETLKDKFATESPLHLVEKDGDWDFAGAITNYQTTPIAPTGSETTALNRLTISVKVDFTSLKDEKASWSQSFSRYEDYESTQTLSSVENDLIKKISEQLADDIFLKVASNW